MPAQMLTSWAELLTGTETGPAAETRRARGEQALVIRGYLIGLDSPDELSLVSALGELAWRRSSPLARWQREQEQHRQGQE